MAVVIHTGGSRSDWWLRHLRGLLPEFDLRPLAEPGDPADIEQAIVWKPPPGALRRFPNLTCILSIGAGIDHILADPELPRRVPIIRTTGPDLRQRMREYVTLHVLRLHRRLPEVEAGQRARSWRQLVLPPAPERRVGVMGMGNLGQDCAVTLRLVGFDVAGWSRRPKTIEGISSFAGPEQLHPFLARTEILVCLLPLTEATRGILNADLFAALPRGACVVNAARGQHLVEGDLLDALGAGQIGYATLDVFQEEPLPSDHPFWAHPQVLVTPHIASLIDPEAGGCLIAHNLRAFVNGAPVPDLVDLEQGY